jgi:hypothetical protein
MIPLNLGPPKELTLFPIADDKRESTPTLPGSQWMCDVGLLALVSIGLGYVLLAAPRPSTWMVEDAINRLLLCLIMLGGLLPFQCSM